MRKLGVFNLVTLDGYFAGPGGDISWHTLDPEFQAVANEAANAGNTLLFGRVTYELMAGYWPTPEAMKSEPKVARGMNSSEKIVFSRTLKSADWNNTRLVKDDMPSEVRRLKQGSGKGLTILGSGSLVSQLAQERLIDEFRILLVPVVLGQGRTMFEGGKDRFPLRLVSSQAFKNGTVLLSYEPVR